MLFWQNLFDWMIVKMNYLFPENIKQHVKNIDNNIDNKIITFNNDNKNYFFRSLYHKNTLHFIQIIKKIYFYYNIFLQQRLRINMVFVKYFFITCSAYFAFHMDRTSFYSSEIDLIAKNMMLHNKI